MAAYSASVILDVPSAQRISKGLMMICGRVYISNYNSTRVEVAGITKYFQKLRCVVASESNEGYTFVWAANSFKAYMMNYDATADGAMIELTDDVDAGIAEFIAIGDAK